MLFGKAVANKINLTLRFTCESLHIDYEDCSPFWILALKDTAVSVNNRHIQFHASQLFKVMLSLANPVMCSIFPLT